MPQLLPIHNVGHKGLNLDISQEELGPEFLTGGINFRVTANKIESVPGDMAYSTPTSFVAGHIVPVRAVAAPFVLVAGKDDVKCFNGSAWTSIKRSGMPDLGSGAELLWTDCKLGQIPILNNSSDFPVYWSPQTAATALQLLLFKAGSTWSAMSKKCKVIRSHGTYLFALNLNESGVDYPDSFRWSHPADINGLPYTWDETDVASVAGIQAAGAGGALVDGLSLGDLFVLYSESAIHVLRRSGDELIWNKRLITDKVGIVAKNAVIEVNGIHLFISNGDIMQFDGSSVRSIAHNKIKNSLITNINKQYINRSYAVKVTDKSEAWFCVPQGNSTLPNIAYVYNWLDDSWAIRAIAAGTAYMSYAPRISSTYNATWDSDNETWDSDNTTWDYSPYVTDNPISVINSNGQVNLVDFNESTVANSCRIERLNLRIGNLDTATTITRVYPRMIGKGEVKIQFGSHDYPNAPIRWKEPIIFNPAEQRKIEFRTTGKLHAYNVSSDNNFIWCFTGFDIEYELTGNR